MMNPAEKTLVKESEWMRVYRLNEKETYLYESKFLMDDLRISPSTIRERWTRLTLEEKVEFSSAFGSQPPRDADDLAILAFLMERGPEDVWRNIATLLPFHPSRDEALGFLLKRIEQEGDSRANYYQAMELISGVKAIPTLTRQFQEYQNLVRGKSPKGDESAVWSDYLQCTKCLFTLTRDVRFLSVLRQEVGSVPPSLRSHATQLLAEAEKPSDARES